MDAPLIWTPLGDLISFPRTLLGSARPLLQLTNRLIIHGTVLPRQAKLVSDVRQISNFVRCLK